MDKNTIYATLIDFVGIILMVVYFWIAITYKIIPHLAFIFPLIAYFITWKKYPKKFWVAFFVSFALLCILVFLSIRLAFY